MDIDTTSTLASAIILSTLCAYLGQDHSKPSAIIYIEILVVSALGLGALVTPFPNDRYFLMMVLGYAAYSLFKSHCASTIKTISLVQIALAIFLILVPSFTGEALARLAGLFLGVTLVPLPPFHLPFATLVSSAKGTLAGLWTTVFLCLGLAELREFHTFLSVEWSGAVSWLALGSAFYASFKCLGQTHIRPLLTYATIAHVSLLWGLTTVFSTFSQWAMPFGLTIALVITGLIVAYHFVQQRFGSHALGKLPGLGSSMPRFGTMLIILISIAMLLPMIPILTGLTTIPTSEIQDVPLVIITLIILIVWMFGSWYFSRLLHQTAFGKARPDIPYRDLRTAEICALALLILGASYSGLFY